MMGKMVRLATSLRKKRKTNKIDLIHKNQKMIKKVVDKAEKT
jgi:hypothetical protein